MLRATFRSLLARKLRLVLSGIAIVLGVSFVVGSLVLTDTLGSVFDHIFASAEANTAVVVRGTTTGVSGTRNLVPESVLGRVRAVPGVLAASGDTSGYAQLVDRHNRAYPYSSGPPAIGLNYDPDKRLSAIEFVAGRGPVAPDEIAIDLATANATKYHVGDLAPVLSLLPRQDYRIVGIFTVAGNVNEAGASLILFTSSQAQHVMGQLGQFNTISVAAASGVSDTQLRDRIARVLPPGLQAVTGTQQANDSANQYEQEFSFFGVFLLVFAGVALFVGAFLIFNTFTMLVAQRQRELAVLRSLGASRRQVIGSVLAEALAVGFVAASAGLGIGLLVALGLRALVSHLGGGPLPSSSLVVASRTYISAYAIGIVVTALAALVPARRAARIPPIAAIQEVAVGEVSGRRSAVSGIVLLAVGLPALVAGLRGALLLLAAGVILTFLAVVALSRFLVRPLVSVIGAPLAQRMPGALGRRNAMRNTRRTSATAGALMIGLALVSAASILGASLKTSVSDVIKQTFAADLAICTASSCQGISPAVVTKLTELPAVGRADALAFASAEIDGRKVNVAAIPGGAFGRTVDLEQKAGTITMRPGAILVDSATADKYHWHVGDVLTIRYDRGPSHALTIVGIYAANTLAVGAHSIGSYVVDPTERVDFPNQLDDWVLVKAKPGVSVATLTNEVGQVMAAYPNVDVQSRSQFIGAVQQQVNTLLNFVTVLLGLSVAIAVLGIVNTLALSVIERTRELGLLRAVGLSRGQLRQMIRSESVIVAIYGALLGTVVGTGFGVAITKALQSQGFTAVTFPVARMAIFILVAAMAGVVAAIWPARRAARINVLEAIATE